MHHTKNCHILGLLIFTICEPHMLKWNHDCSIHLLFVSEGKSKTHE